MLLQSFSPPTLEQDGDTPSYGLLLSLANVAVRGAAREAGARSPSPSSRSCAASPGRPASAPPPDSLERRRLGLVLERVTTLLLEQVPLKSYMICMFGNLVDFAGPPCLSGGKRPNSGTAVAPKRARRRVERHHRHLAPPSRAGTKPWSRTISCAALLLKSQVARCSVCACLALACYVKVWEDRAGCLHEVCVQPGTQHVQMSCRVTFVISK